MIASNSKIFIEDIDGSSCSYLGEHRTIEFYDLSGTKFVLPITAIVRLYNTAEHILNKHHNSTIEEYYKIMKDKPFRFNKSLIEKSL